VGRRVRRGPDDRPSWAEASSAFIRTGSTNGKKGQLLDGGAARRFRRWRWALRRMLERGGFEQALSSDGGTRRGSTIHLPSAEGGRRANLTCSGDGASSKRKMTWPSRPAMLLMRGPWCLIGAGYRLARELGPVCAGLWGGISFVHNATGVDTLPGESVTGARHTRSRAPTAGRDTRCERRPPGPAARRMDQSHRSTRLTGWRAWDGALDGSDHKAAREPRG